MPIAASATSPCSRSARCFASDEPEGQTIKAAAVRRGTARAEGVGRHWNGGGRARRCLRRQGRRAGAAGGARHSGRRPAGRGRRTGLVPSRPLRHAAVRPEERRRRLRRGSSEGAEGARPEGPAGRLRAHSRRAAAAEGEADQDEAEAGPVRLPAAHPRLRLRGRPRRGGGRHRQGGARAPSASSSSASTCSTSTRAPASTRTRSRWRSP